MGDKTAEKNEGLNASLVSTWAKKTVDMKNRESQIAQMLIWNCPCNGASIKKRRSLPLDEASCKMVLEGLKNRPSLLWDCFDSAKKLKSCLIDAKMAADKVPSGTIERVYFVQSPKSVLKKYGMSSIPGSHRTFLEIDGLFRHLRNAIAHGYCARVKRGKNGREPFWFLQDVNTNGMISARIYVSSETLTSWDDYLNSVLIEQD
jgi:hypothetical protein